MVIEAYFFTGIVFGFPNLRVILETEGIWNGTCIDTDDETDCSSEHQANYKLVGQLAIIFGNVMSLPLGLVLDKYGTFYCRLYCSILITTGLVLLFFVNMEPMLLFPALPCLGAGGFTLLTSNFQLSMLTNVQSLVVMAIQVFKLQ